jgi:hypothetical protein
MLFSDLNLNEGRVFKSNADLLARFHPSDRNRDYGLDALYLWPNGEIWFSTEEGFNDQIYGTIQGGDLLSDQGIIVFRNLELISAFAPIEDLADFGLDALFVVTDLSSADRPRFTQITANRQTGNVLLEWIGPGRVFQLEKSRLVTGPYEPVTPIIPDLFFNDAGALQAALASFYRLRQW